MGKWKKIFEIVCILCVCVFLVACASEKTDVVGYYQYPIDDYMKESQLLEVCRISEDILKKMSDEQLAQAVIDFPLLPVVELSSSGEYGVEWLKNNSDAYRELLQREDAKDALIEKIKELEDNPNYDMLVEILRDVVVNEKIFNDTFTEEEKEYLKISAIGYDTSPVC